MRCFRATIVAVEKQ